jgi:hypothetical protein
MPAAEVGPTVSPSPPGLLNLCFSDLGLGFRDDYLLPFLI